MNHDITSLSLQTGRRKHSATVAPPFQMRLWCKSVAISRIGFRLRNPGQSQTLMCYRKFRFHAISADLQSGQAGVGEGPERRVVQTGRSSLVLTLSQTTSADGSLLCCPFPARAYFFHLHSPLNLSRRRLIWSILFVFWLPWGWFLASSLPFSFTQMHNQLPDRRHITKSNKLSVC